MTTVFTSGPVNIEQGNSANFAIEFLDSSGNLTVPSGGTLTVTYTNTSGSSTADSVTLTEDNSFFTGTWSTATASLGLATWVALATGSSVTQATGQIRVIERQGG